MQALSRTNAEHSPRSIDEREAFSTPYWPARNGPGRLGGRGIRHIASAGAAFATLRLTINGVRATPPNEAHRMGQRKLFSYPFCPFAPTTPSPNFPFFVTLAFFGA